MEIRETLSGIQFMSVAASEKLGLFAILFLLTLIPLVKSGIESYKEYSGRLRFAVLLFYSGMAGLLLLFASLCYPVSQYYKPYKVELDYKETAGEVRISTSPEEKMYKTSLSNIETFVFSRIRKNKKTNYELQLLRRDGLRIGLGTYPEKEWTDVRNKIQKTGLPLQESELQYFFKPNPEFKIAQVQDENALCTQFFLGMNCQQSERGIVLNWDLTINSLFYKLGIGILIVAWLFVVFQTLARNFNWREYLFVYGIMLTLSLAFGYYFLNTFHAKQYLSLSPQAYNSYTESQFLGKTQSNEGKWKEAKLMMIEIGPNKNGGILICESTYENQDLLPFLKENFGNAMQGKYKYIRMEGLSIYKQLQIADYFLAQQNTYIQP